MAVTRGGYRRQKTCFEVDLVESRINAVEVGRIQFVSLPVERQPHNRSGSHQIDDLRCCPGREVDAVQRRKRPPDGLSGHVTPYMFPCRSSAKSMKNKGAPVGPMSVN